MDLWAEGTYFSVYNLFLTDEMLHASRYTFAISMANVSRFLVPPIQTFTTRTRHAAYTVSNQAHAFHIVNARRKALCETDSPVSDSMKALFLSASRLIVILPHPQNL